jgi:hypothetical protein
MRSNGHKPQRVPAAQAAGTRAESAEAVLDDVLHPSANRITSPLGFPLLPVVIGYGFLVYVAIAKLASMAIFHEEQVVVVGGKIYLGAVGLSLLFTVGGWASEIAAQRIQAPPLADADSSSVDGANSGI